MEGVASRLIKDMLKREKNIIKYLTLLQKFDNQLILISVRDTPGIFVNNAIDTGFHNLGLRENLKNKHWHGYVAVIQNGRVIYEKLGEENKSIRFFHDGETSIEMESSPYKSGDRAKIIVNKTDYSINKRGINIVVYDETGNSLTDAVCFDTHNRLFPCYREMNTENKITYRQKVKTKMLVSDIVLWGNEIVTQDFYVKWHNVLNIKRVITGRAEELNKVFIPDIKIEMYQRGCLHSNVVIICRDSDDYYYGARDTLRNDGLVFGEEMLRYDIADAILDDQPIMLFLGYCQSLGVKQIYDNCPTFYGEYKLIHCHIGRVTKRWQRGFLEFQMAVKLSDVIIRIASASMRSEDDIEWDFEANLPAHTKSFFLPQLLFRGFKPYMDSDQVKYNEESRVFGVLKYPYLYEEKCINELVSENLSNDEIVDRLMSKNLYTKDEILQNFKIAMRFIKLQSQRSDVDMYDYIEDNILKRRLYYEGVHYENPLYFELARRLARVMGLECDAEIDRFERYCEQNEVRLQMATEVPILPCVAATLGVEFDNREQMTYRVKVSDDAKVVKDIDAREWIVEYADYVRSVKRINEIRCKC